MTTGIYKLEFPSKLPYIGQSVNIENRYREHCRDMRNGNHYGKVQLEYNKYKELPSIEILAECNIEELNTYENECIEIWDSVNNGLNTLSKAEYTPNGTVSCGEVHPHAGYSNKQYEQVFFSLLENKLTHKEIAQIFNVSLALVATISKGAGHLWLKDKYPNEYAIMVNINRSIGPRITNKRPLLQSPDGNIYDLNNKNVTLFAKEHKLHKGHMYDVLNGKRKSHAGWKQVRENSNV